jgi:mannose-6-phosphate isomerase
MSDATFRVYDWGRVGPDGRPRELHIEQALASIDFDAGPVEPVRPEPAPIAGGVRESLVSCPYFTLNRLRLTGPSPVGSRERFTLLLGLGGSVGVRHGGESHALRFGQTMLLPAEIGSCEVVPTDEGATVLECTVD